MRVKNWCRYLCHQRTIKWGFTEIVSYIISLNKDKYGKYADISLEWIKAANIDGLSLKDVTSNDRYLHRFGITLFEDNNNNIFHVYNSSMDSMYNKYKEGWDEK